MKAVQYFRYSLSSSDKIISKMPPQNILEFSFFSVYNDPFVQPPLIAL